MFDTWLRTVVRLIISLGAIVALPFPRHQSRISRSRSVRAGKVPRVEPDPVAKWAMTRAAISGPKMASPAAAARIARTISSWSAPLSR